MRVYATYDHIAQTALALETKVRIMPLYEKIFDIAYPLPKLDVRPRSMCACWFNLECLLTLSRLQTLV